MNVWNRKLEFMSRAELDQVQVERLQATINRAVNNVPFYRDRFDTLGISPETIRTRAGLAAIPFTTRGDLVANQPYGFFAVSLRDIRRIHSSSGTTGRPVVVGYTANDKNHWQEVLARILRAIGIDSVDIVQISFAYGLFSGGFGLDMGAEHIGATVIPVSVGTVAQQVRIMRDYHTTCLFSTPSYAVQIASHLAEQGIPRNELTLRRGLFGAEPWGEDIRHRIEEGLGIEAYDIYGISELMGPGVAGECDRKNGLHIWEDHFFPEIVDPDTGAQLEPGAEGELVITTLTREAMPLIRYRTGDITTLDVDPCPCGRNHARLRRIKSRITDLLIVRGVNVYRHDIEELLGRLFHVPVRYQLIAVSGPEGDNLEILIEVTDQLFGDEMRRYRHMEATLRHEIAGRLSFEPVVRFVEPSHFPSPGEKYPRILDRRGAER